MPVRADPGAALESRSSGPHGAVSPPAGFPEDLSPAIVEAIEKVSARSSQYQEQHQRGVSS